MVEIITRITQAAFFWRRPLHTWPAWTKPVVRAILNDFFVEYGREMDLICDGIRRHMDQHEENQDRQWIQAQLRRLFNITTQRQQIFRMMKKFT